MGGGGGLSGSGGSAGPATSGNQSTVSGVTFGSVNTGGALPTWLIVAAVAAVLFLLYGRRK